VHDQVFFVPPDLSESLRDQLRSPKRMKESYFQISSSNESALEGKMLACFGIKGWEDPLERL